MPLSRTASGPGALLALVLAVFFSASAGASSLCPKQVAARAANAETASTLEGLHFLLVPYFSDAPHSFLLDGSAILFAHSFLASLPQSASEFEAGGPKILVVNEPALDPVLSSFLRSCKEVGAAHHPDRGEALVAVLKKKLSAYRNGWVARRLYPRKFAQYQKLLERKVVRLGDFLETGFFTDESHLAFAVLSYLAFTHAGVDASVRLGTLTEQGSDASAPSLGKWFHHYAWMETSMQLASFSAGVRGIGYVGSDGAREVAVSSLLAWQMTHQSYSPWTLSAPEHALGTLRVKSLQADHLEQYFEAFRR
jgi:hypothetical protein